MFCSSLGSGPRTCDPSKGAVLTVLKTWGWKPKFLSKVSLRRNWRLECGCKFCRDCRHLGLLDDGQFLQQQLRSLVFQRQFFNDRCHHRVCSLRPWAKRAVEAMVSIRDGWSNQETLSEASVSPRSIRDALGALEDLEGLALNVPLDDVTAWRNNWYWAAETFFRDPSSSS